MYRCRFRTLVLTRALGFFQPILQTSGGGNDQMRYFFAGGHSDHIGSLLNLMPELLTFCTTILVFYLELTACTTYPGSPHLSSPMRGWFE
jgi:hypothetical protein